MTIKEDPCYFWIDSNLPENDQLIVAICKDCQQKEKKENAWFWEHGYGNFSINCHICKKFIKKVAE